MTSISTASTKKLTKTSTKKKDNPDVLCGICCEPANKTSRKIIQCPFCEKESCLSCLKQYISSSVKDPHCMYCYVAWHRDFVKKTFPSSWMSKEYKDLREKLLFDLELAKIPETQSYCDEFVQLEDTEAEREASCEKMKQIKLELAKTSKSYEEVTQDIWIAKDSDDKGEIERLKTLSHQLYQQLATLENLVKECQEENRNLNHICTTLKARIQSGNTTAKDVKDKFFLACPVGNCKGFINELWTCGICKSIICSDCHEKICESHQCNENTKASISVLQTESKPCPKCGSLISKISGCDQMWCTQCRTAFSWNTGIIENHIVHNPHYFDWLRQQEENGRDNVTEVPHMDCNQPIIDLNDTFTLVGTINRREQDATKRELALNLARLVIHIQRVELPALLPKYIIENPVDPNRNLRIQYMLGRIDEDKFRSQLHKREKDRLKREDLSNVLQMFTQVADEVLKQYLWDDEKDRISFESFHKQSEALRVYTNDCLEKVANQFNCKRKYITDGFQSIESVQKPQELGSSEILVE